MNTRAKQEKQSLNKYVTISFSFYLRSTNFSCKRNHSPFSLIDFRFISNYSTGLR